MQKRKSMNWLFKVLALVMTFCMSFTFAGCFGLDFGDIDEEELNNMTDEELAEWLEDSSMVKLYGTKVMYKSSSYNFDESSRPIDDPETVNEYYSQYAWHILENMHNVYSVVNADYFAGSGKQQEISTLTYPDTQILPYIYDTSRYVITKGEEYQYFNLDGSEGGKFVVTADTSYAWNWSYDVQTEYIEENEEGEHQTLNFNAFITDGSGDIKTRRFENETGFVDAVNRYYLDPIFRRGYQTAYVGGGDYSSYSLYSQYSKVLSYVIYRYALDLPIANIEITPITSSTPLADGEKVDEKFVRITIGGESVDKAFADTKALFDKYGRIVGVDDGLISKIKTWVLENVIGENAQRQVSPTKIVYTQKTNQSGQPLFKDDSENVYAQSKVGEGESARVVFLDDENQEVDITDLNLTPIYVQSSSSNLYTYDREYSTILDQILAKVNTIVSIGGIEGDEEESNVAVNNPYLASEVVEYAGGMFSVVSDKNFPRAKSPNANALTAIPAREYQSVTLMFKEKVELGTIVVALKYDSDCDGDGEVGEVDQSGDDYIELSLQLNHYNHASGKLKTYYSPKLRVYSGSYDFGYDETGWDWVVGKEDMSDVTSHTSGYVFDGLDELGEISAFNPNIGNKVLMTDVGFNNYKGKPLVTQTPVQITGHARLKNWYKIYGGGNTFYTGRLNHEMFKNSGSEGCDYVEISYEVYKNPSAPLEKNYKFYTSIIFM